MNRKPQRKLERDYLCRCLEQLKSSKGTILRRGLELSYGGWSHGNYYRSVNQKTRDSEDNAFVKKL